jgi:hypothetical protein
VYWGFVRVVFAASVILNSWGAFAQSLAPGLDELRIGGGVSSSDRLTGNIQFNALSSPLRSEMPYDPDLWWLFSPRALVGALLSVSGSGTNQAVAGLVWGLPLYGPFFAEGSVGGSVHDQKLFQIYSDRPELTTRFLFRQSIAVGLEINPVWRITAFLDHESNETWDIATWVSTTPE